MAKLLQLAILMCCVNLTLKAQLGTSTIGTSTLGTNDLTFPVIGKSDTPYCAFPGPCGSTIAIYHFIGAGNWNIEGNWEANLIPPTVLTDHSQILIDPAGSAECLLNIPLQSIPAGTSITIVAGKKLRIPGTLATQ